MDKNGDQCHCNIIRPNTDVCECGHDYSWNLEIADQEEAAGSWQQPTTVGPDVPEEVSNLQTSQLRAGSGSFQSCKNGGSSSSWACAECGASLAKQVPRGSDDRYYQDPVLRDWLCKSCWR